MFLNSFLNGSSQVMLQQQPITGALFLIAIGFNSWQALIAAILGLSIGSLIGYLLKTKNEDWQQGLYGYNPMLTALALNSFFHFNQALLVIIVLASILSVLLTHYFLLKQIPTLTFPFVAISLLSLEALEYIPLIDPIESPLFNPESSWLNALLLSFSQVMLQENILTGALFLIALCIAQRLQIVWAVLALTLGLLLQNLMEISLQQLSSGLFGFSLVLTILALLPQRSFVQMLLGILLTCLFSLIAYNLSWNVLTLPFVLATWLIYAARYQYVKNFKA